MTEAKRIESAKKAMGELKADLRAIAEINRDAGRDEIWLVVSEHLAELEALHARMGLSILKYMPDVSVRGPGGR
jgi:hypothetical protein